MVDYSSGKNSERLISLDVFRGITIAAMIFVNNTGGRTFPQLKHAKWHGWTLADLIFPFFLFIVGVAIVYSFSKRIESGEPKKSLYLKILRRSIILFLLGLILNLTGFNLANFRIPGVLQRIAITYAIASILVLHTKIKAQAYITIGILIVYWLILKEVPVPGYGAGILEPGGNICGYIDSMILKGHTWQYAVAPGFDPQGILSTIPSIANVLFGVLTGHWLMSDKTKLDKVVGLFVIGNLAIAISYLISIWLPFNKKLGTTSFTILIGGMALLLLAICYWFIEIKGNLHFVFPFLVFGMNAITVYFLSSLCASAMVYWIKIPIEFGKVISLKTYLYQTLFESWADPISAALLYGLWYVLIWFGLMLILYRKKIFIKI